MRVVQAPNRRIFHYPANFMNRAALLTKLQTRVTVANLLQLRRRRPDLARPWQFRVR